MSEVEQTEWQGRVRDAMEALRSASRPTAVEPGALFAGDDEGPPDLDWLVVEVRGDGRAARIVPVRDAEELGPGDVLVDESDETWRVAFSEFAAWVPARSLRLRVGRVAVASLQTVMGALRDPPASDARDDESQDLVARRAREEALASLRRMPRLVVASPTREIERPTRLAASAPGDAIVPPGAGVEPSGEHVVPLSIPGEVKVLTYASGVELLIVRPSGELAVPRAMALHDEGAETLRFAVSPDGRVLNTALVPWRDGRVRLYVGEREGEEIEVLLADERPVG